MKVFIRCANSRYPENEQEFDTTVVYPRDCVVSIISTHSDGRLSIAINHPFTTELTEHDDYPEKRLWVTPNYSED